MVRSIAPRGSASKSPLTVPCSQLRSHDRWLAIASQLKPQYRTAAHGPLDMKRPSHRLAPNNPFPHAPTGTISVTTPSHSGQVRRTSVNATVVRVAVAPPSNCMATTWWSITSLSHLYTHRPYGPSSIAAIALATDGSVAERPGWGGSITTVTTSRQQQLSWHHRAMRLLRLDVRDVRSAVEGKAHRRTNTARGCVPSA